jgi:mono/diheme cytochrome c family protein
MLQTNGRLVLLDKTNLRETTILKESPMPSFKDKLDDQEIADVIAYLRSLRGRP